MSFLVTKHCSRWVTKLSAYITSEGVDPLAWHTEKKKQSNQKAKYTAQGKKRLKKRWYYVPCSSFQRQRTYNQRRLLKSLRSQKGTKINDATGETHPSFARPIPIWLGCLSTWKICNASCAAASSFRNLFLSLLSKHLGKELQHR